MSVFIVTGSMILGLLSAHGQEMDTAYGDLIKEYTTSEMFLNEMVDHLPKSDTVPSPLEHFGTIIGAPGRLHYTHEIYGYLREVAKASPRVMVRVIGRTEEDREMIEVIISDAATLENIEKYRTDLSLLADPRKINDAQADAIIKTAKPVYYITAGLHSPETGSPEMVMELAYRLATGESPMLQHIRKNVILVFNPATEADGRDRMVDVYKYRANNKGVNPRLIYWGHYLAHDNNRDGYGMALQLSRRSLDSFIHWSPTVMHDLHESVPYLYVSTGTGPYNEYLDPITIDEWHNLAHEEVTELTRRGMPGVWTHAFYTGWAANYLSWMANTRNSIGRFYETFGNSVPENFERKLRKSQTSRKWYRPSPPLEKVEWSLRNNTNYMQSGVLVALNYTATNRQRFVENFYIKSKNAIKRGTTDAPHAWVIPADQKRAWAAAALVKNLQEQGIEVHRATKKLSWKNRTGPQADKQPMTAEKGAWVIRLDQPYQTLIRILMDKQNFPEGERPPYDDVGWTFPYAFNVKAHKVDDPSILSAKMERAAEPVALQGKLMDGNKSFFLIQNTAEENLAIFRLLHPELKIQAAETAFKVKKKKYAAGSFIIEKEKNGDNLKEILQKAAREFGLQIEGTGKLPEVATHNLDVPRVGLIHTWVATPQDGGSWRYTFDKYKLPYTYLSEQDLATTDLNNFDVLIMPSTRASATQLINGTTDAGEPIPWKKTAAYPNIGIIDETDDIRKGMGYTGLENLKNFLEKGGVFIVEGAATSLPIEMGLIRRTRITRPEKLVARGSIMRSTVTDEKSPIVYGYDSELPIFFSQAPVFSINKNVGNYRTPEWMKDLVWEQEVPRVVLSFAKKNVLMSGMLRGGSAIQGKPLLLDAPVGKGHVILFANRPMRRYHTRGNHALVFNTLLHWNDLRVGWPERPGKKEGK